MTIGLLVHICGGSAAMVIDLKFGKGTTNSDSPRRRRRKCIE